MNDRRFNLPQIVVPVHPVARSLAIAEALVGQLYPAIPIGRLVSLQTSAREGR